MTQKFVGPAGMGQPYGSSTTDSHALRDSSSHCAISAEQTAPIHGHLSRQGSTVCLQGTNYSTPSGTVRCREPCWKLEHIPACRNGPAKMMGGGAAPPSDRNRLLNVSIRTQVHVRTIRMGIRGWMGVADWASVRGRARASGIPSDQVLGIIMSTT